MYLNMINKMNGNTYRDILLAYLVVNVIPCKLEFYTQCIQYVSC